MIVVDSNVVSELMKPAPAEVVRERVMAHKGASLYTTSITLAEVRYGIERLPSGRRKKLLTETAESVFSAFENQVLPFDASAAMRCASIVTIRESLGLPIDGFDAQIASICSARGAALCTRNVKDFRNTGIDVIDPWQA